MAWRSRPNRPELDATKPFGPLDVMWAAGFYEGEGTARLCGHGKRSLAGSVPQKDPEVLYWLRDWFGGSVNPPSRTGSNPCYKWDICGDRCRIFLALIYPYLSSRRRGQIDAINALEFLDGKSPEEMSLEDLGLHLAAFYQEKRKDTWRVDPSGNGKRRYQRRKSEDPTFLPRLLERNRVWKKKQEELTKGE